MNDEQKIVHLMKRFSMTRKEAEVILAKWKRALGQVN